MNIFLENLSSGDINKFPINAMEFVALPLHAYRAKRTIHINYNNLNQHWVLMGDAALGGPYFQSISAGYEAAIYFAYIFKEMGRNNVEQMLTKYEDYMERLWLAIQIRSKEIHRNKEILEAICADDHDSILDKMKIY